MRLQQDNSLIALRRNNFAFIAIFLLVLICYSNTFHGEWHFDDSVNIVENKAIHMKEITWQSIKSSFFAGGDRNGAIYHPHLYRPVACFSLALNHYWDGFNTTGYHLFNIAVHILAVIFLYLFIYHTLNIPALWPKYGTHSYSIALLTALFWGLHPIQIDSVTFVTQRMSSMAGLFFIMAMYFYLRGRIFEDKILKYTLYALTFIAGLLAMGSKENAVMLPVCILLFDLFFIQGITKEKLRAYCAVFLWITFLGILITYALSGWETFSLDTLLKGYERREFSLYERLLTQPRVLVMYLGLLFYPMADRMSFTHDVLLSRGLFEPSETILSILLLGAIIFLAIKKAKQWPLISYCILFFFINQLIESSIFPLELSYEHRNYIPSMLLFLPVSIAIIKGITCISWNRNRQLGIALSIALILIVLGYQTHKYNSVWKTEHTLWKHAIKRNYNPRALFNYAGTIYKQGYLEEALTWWGVVSAYNQLYYGKNHSENKDIVPYGSTIQRARMNLKIIEFVKQAGYGEELKKAALNMRLKFNVGER